MTEKELKQYLIDEIDLQKEFLNQHEVGFIREDEEERLSAMETAFNLINKQQKEIEGLKLITKEYDSYIGEKMPVNSKIIIADREYFINGTFVNKFISKDKIRDKILELTGIKGELEEKDFGIGFTLEDCYKEITIKIKAYKELLEE